MSLKVYTPPNCSGPLRECQARDKTLTEARWNRGQMRGHAGYWRHRHEIAAILGKPVEEVASTAIYLATVYRNDALKLEGQP